MKRRILHFDSPISNFRHTDCFTNPVHARRRLLRVMLLHLQQVVLMLLHVLQAVVVQHGGCSRIRQQQLRLLLQLLLLLRRVPLSPRCGWRG